MVLKTAGEAIRDARADGNHAALGLDTPIASTVVGHALWRVYGRIGDTEDVTAVHLLRLRAH